MTCAKVWGQGFQNHLWSTFLLLQLMPRYLAEGKICFWTSISCSSLPASGYLTTSVTAGAAWFTGVFSGRPYLLWASLKYHEGRCFIFIYGWTHLDFGHWATLPGITCPATSRARTQSRTVSEPGRLFSCCGAALGIHTTGQGLETGLAPVPSPQARH